jgi:hypothetical protein
LALRGKKSGFTRNLVVKYLAAERLGLPEPVIEGVLKTFRGIGPLGQGWIDRSFLSAGLKKQYQALVISRHAQIFGS